MKKLLLFSLFVTSLLLYSNNSLEAQTKDDIVQCLGSILELPEMNDIYQNQMAGGQMAVINSPRYLFKHERGHEYQVNEEDFPNLYSVVFSTVRNAELNNINQAYMLNYNFKYYPEHELLVFNTNITLNDDRREKQLGFFKFQKNEAQEWALESQSIKKEQLKFPVPPIRIECNNQ